MPFSQSSQISTIVQFMESLRPVSILDVGIGMGQYGYLARTHLEHVNLFEIQGSSGKLRPKKDWKIRIDGIEGFGGYITPVQDWAYHNIMIGNALEILASIPADEYELVLGIDILEHFTKADGELFLRHVKRIASKAALISTPKCFIEQNVAANPYENHRSQWKKKELLAKGFSKILENELSWIAVAE